MNPDIETEKDIQTMVNSFYDKVLKNETLKPLFAHINFEKHLPRMVQFWCFAILETPGYTTNLFEVHKNMPLQKIHFNTWLGLFNETIDEFFEGPNASRAKQKALIIGISMESKITF